MTAAFSEKAWAPNRLDGPANVRLTAHSAAELRRRPTMVTCARVAHLPHDAGRSLAPSNLILNQHVAPVDQGQRPACSGKRRD
jgi:hypothetical protein